MTTVSSVKDVLSGSIIYSWVTDFDGRPCVFLADPAVQAITSRRSRDYLRQMSLRKRKDFNKLFAGASPEAIDFLQKTLAFNPRKRPTVEECLAHPYLAAYHDPDDEPSVQSLPPSYFAYDLQPRPSAAQLREQMWKEVESLPRYI